MQKRTRSLLDELAYLPAGRDRENLVESRATHVISSAINLLTYIKENYTEEESAELERRLLNSIRTTDPNKFIRGVRRFRNNS